MPAIRILDEMNTPLLDVPLLQRAGLGKYLPDRAVQLMAVRSIGGALGKRLSESATTPVALELAVPEAVALGGGGDLAIDAGMRIGVGVHQADELLFPADDLRDAISVPSGTAYVSVTLSPRVAASLDGERGPLAFGFAAGASLTVRFFHPFDVAGQDPTLADALAAALAAFVIPGDTDDLAAMPPGCYAALEGHGHVHLKGTAELVSITNPLATASLPVVGTAGITAGASATVGADWRASGRFEMRVAREAGDRVRLAYYRHAGSEITIDAAASLGVAASVRGRDPIRFFLRAVSSDPEADLAQLIDAGLSDAQIETLQRAVQESVDRSLRAATELRFSALRRGEAVFAWEIDTAALDAAGRTAVESALRGRLSDITEAAGSEGAVRLVHTGAATRQARRVTWRINLFGVLNVRSVSELLRNGSLSYDPVSGSLNAADAIASQKILVRTRPFESDGAAVRKLVFESMLLTAAYHASRAASGLALSCSASYFEARQRTSARDIVSDYHAIAGLQLADASERTRRMGAEHEFGPSTFLVECALDTAAADTLFIGPHGALPREFYERVGRDALLALVPESDTDRAHRRRAVEHERTWAALKAAGPAAARPQLERTLDAVRGGHIISDYLLIQWWADAMHGAARALVSMRQFLHGRSAADLAADPEFARRRRTLEKELAEAVKESRSQFGDPWGILALDAASGRRASVQATIVSPRLTAAYTERVAADATVGGARDLAAAAPALVRKAPRPFTAEERELLRRHAVNLRLGAFSSDGEFQTDEADVRRIFTELLPRELEARKAEGRKLRLLFYAHGGLIGEREGLVPVLARLKFWRRNHVYPLSFVWETGLRETITDILRGLGGARDIAARGLGEDLADAFLEVAARPAGRRVWSQMKRSAEVSVLEGGGAAFVANMARDFWQAHHEDMEIHAAGHSAGAIFQAHFLPALLAPAPGGTPPAVRTLHLLAPACTTALFTTKLADRVGAGKGIDALTMYTMNKSLELDDRAGPYKKSLLYLVSRAFEGDQPTRILGLEESIRQEAGLIRFFGLAGRDKRADLIFSTTPPDAPLDSRSLSTTHGGFDDDAATMSSLMRRVLGVPDDVPIVDFFQEELAADAAPPGDALAAVSGAERGEPAPAVLPSVVVGVPPIDAGPAGGGLAPPAAGARRALCVGIDRYGDPYDLAGCVNDARNWAKRLGELGFAVTSLHDEAATRTALLAALEALVAGARAGDVIVFQFAGHGTQVDDLDGDETDDAFDEAFCPADFADGRLLIDDDVRAVVAGLAAGVNLTCFIDCCHSGTITRAMRPGAQPPVILPGSRPRFIRYSHAINERHRAFRAAVDGPAGGGGVRRSLAAQVMREVCFSACQPHEVAYETAGAGQFTTHALGVLAAGPGLSHEAFLERVVTAFGTRAAQRPHLDCTEDALGRTLLQPLAGVAPPLAVRS